jgi:5-methylcytosine-specific restriction endonuclease McrA
MSRKVLILNQDYRAITVCSVHRAFLLVYCEKAEMVAEARSTYLRTMSRSFPAPSIIRLLKYVHIPYKGVILNRQNIFRRDRFTCQYCGVGTELTIDHVLPRSRGGPSSWENLVTACKLCNSRKGDNTPEEAAMPLIQKPFKPSFFMFLKNYSGQVDEEWLMYLGQKSKVR